MTQPDNVASLELTEAYWISGRVTNSLLTNHLRKM